MNELERFSGSGEVLRMSSVEIAELSGKTHKSVVRDIRAMLDALEKDGADLCHVEDIKDIWRGNGEILRCLPKAVAAR